MLALFPRLLKTQLIEFIEEKSITKNVGILAGARQVGKTTLIQEIIRDRPHLYLNLERKPSIADQIDRCREFQDFQDYLFDGHRFNPQKQILIIDEAQTSARLGTFVRFMKEEWRGVTVILTGSVINELYRETERRPVGRETFFELWPLCFKEFLGAMEQDSLVRSLKEYQWGQTFSEAKHERLMDFYSQYLRVGGLPEVVSYFLLNKDYEKRRNDIFKSYEDDFVRYFSLEEVNLFRRCLEAVSANVGSPSKDTQAIRLDAPGYKKVAGIFSRLEKWKMIVKVEQVGLEPEKNKFFPKRYLYDVGLLSYMRLKGMQTVHLKELASPVLRAPLGGLVENVLCLSLRIQFGDRLFGLKLSSRAEIDFATKSGETIFPIECKISLKFKNNYLKTMQDYLSSYSPKGKGVIFYGGPPLEKPIGNVHALPFYLADEIGRLLNIGR